MKFTAGPFVGQVFGNTCLIVLRRLHPNGSGEVLETITVNSRELPDLKHVLGRAEGGISGKRGDEECHLAMRMTTETEGMRERGNFVFTPDEENQIRRIIREELEAHERRVTSRCWKCGRDGALGPCISHNCKWGMADG